MFFKLNTIFIKYMKAKKKETEIIRSHEKEDEWKCEIKY